MKPWIFESLGGFRFVYDERGSIHINCGIAVHLIEQVMDGVAMSFGRDCLLYCRSALIEALPLYTSA
jgi:hypothetical protein